MADLTLAGPNYSSVAVSDANPVPVPGGALIDVTLSLDTSAYASGDVLADTQEIANAMRVIDGTAILESLILLDEDDQGVALDLYFFNANVAMGTENSAPSISDANARNLLGKVAVATGDYTDLGGVKVVCLRNLGLLLKGGAASRSVWVAAVNGSGTPTYTASGLRLRLGLLLN